ncbi:hypothetical protein CGRA01v4_12854 [Colletotrichum graminicola]|nr:hypothetical protein CGRA01v4_12854 [Colletotrichum graminicola]
MNAVLQKALSITGFCIIHCPFAYAWVIRFSTNTILVPVPSFWEREQPSTRTRRGTFSKRA